jgi:hypothetical protein
MVVELVEIIMAEPEVSKRGTLIRNAFVFQVKLMADGLRDLVLLPVSVIATIVGFLRGGDDPERELNQVIDLGRQTEEWINLFGNHNSEEDSHSMTSIDALFITVEETLKQQYKKDGTSKQTQEEIDEALQAAHDRALKDTSSRT